MKKFLIPLSLIAVIAGGVVLLSSSSKGPHFILKENAVAFGLQDPPGKLERTIPIRNSGTENLVIGAITTDCGCTAALLSSQTIPPGREGTLKVSVDIQPDWQGTFAKHVTIHTNDPAASTFTLPVTGQVKRMFAVDPKVLEFHEVPAGRGGALTLTIQRVAEDKVKVTGAEATVGFLSIDKVYSPDDILTFIKVTLSREAPQGDFDGSILVRTTSPLRSTITVPVSGKILPSQ